MCALKPSKPSSDCYLTHEDEEAGASNLADSLISDTAQLETRAVHDVENEAQLPSWSAVKRLQRPIQEITSLISISKDHRSSHDRSSLVWRNINSSVGAHQDSDVPAMSSWKEFQAEGGERLDLCAALSLALSGCISVRLFVFPFFKFSSALIRQLLTEILRDLEQETRARRSAMPVKSC